MKKYLVTLELRYTGIYPQQRDESYISKKVTIDICTSLDDAIKSGNDVLERLENKYDLHRFPDGAYAKRHRLGRNNGCFGMRNNLVSDLAYLKTPFRFFLTITDLDIMGSEGNDLDSVLSFAEESIARRILSEKDMD